MTADRSMTPFRVTFALVLVMVAVLLAAGCAGQPGTDRISDTGEDNTTQHIITAQTTPPFYPKLISTTTAEIQDIPTGNYIFLEHNIGISKKTISGICPSVYPPGYMVGGPPTYSFDEKNGAFWVMMSSDYNINESLVLFYAKYGSENPYISGASIGSAMPVYTLPDKLRWDNVTIISTTPEGVVTLKYLETQMILKPKDRWSIIRAPVILNSSFGGLSSNCTEEIVVTDSMYNAGLFDKQKIRVTYNPDYR